MAKKANSKLSEIQSKALIETLKTRFNKNMQRHKGLEWTNVESKLKSNPDKLWSLGELERTGGEPDVVGYDKKTDSYLFYDCSPESPAGRRSLCYDREGWESRKEHRPAGTAQDLANEMGSTLLNEVEYRMLQSLGKFDSKTSSWIQTPDAIRKLGGALFADFRFNTVFVYHNTAPSYYGSRGFRTKLSV
ncbi:MAG TPA: DUF4256 domain-containing protein [Bacteroidia bacterium]|nr:DUF4256 domain-containing protein [Bacteroidia bacterium]HRH09469.1 DUF4256 domain-containing protein [Bacteroidia bacterium]